MKIMELGHYHHLFVNYYVAAQNVLPQIPKSLELDLFEGRPVVSWVASTHQDIRLLGLPWKLSDQAYSLILRTYVKKKNKQGEWIRGYFEIEGWFSQSKIKKLYQVLRLGKKGSLDLTRSVCFEPFEKSSRGVFQYEWSSCNQKSREILKLRTIGLPEPAMSGYLEFFATEKYLQFSTQGNRTKSQMFSHAPWFLWEVDEVLLPMQWPGLLFQQLQVGEPASCYVAKGSKVNVGNVVSL
ncbi:MAG: hypothetical protein EXR74_08990 [Bdellovibrionales bacterium]|nr:hypothetical protein [Bdellovibrionales bacterium]